MTYDDETMKRLMKQFPAPPEVMRATDLTDLENDFPPERRRLMTDEEKLEIFGSPPWKGPMPEVPVIKDPDASERS